MHFATHVFFIFTVTALNIKTVEDTDTEIGTETGMEIETETDTHTHTERELQTMIAHLILHLLNRILNIDYYNREQEIYFISICRALR